MKTVSLYKIWRGSEFLEESIASCYQEVDKMLFVSSETSWNGESGNNTRDVVAKWKSKNDVANKIEILDHNSKSQEEQYNAGMDWIVNNCKWCHIVHVIDTDEVWNKEGWENAKKFLAINYGRAITFRCMFRSYLKARDIFIDDTEMGVKPVVFVMPGIEHRGPRYSGNKSLLMEDVCVDHYGLVRSDGEDIIQKIKNSCNGDKSVLVDIDKWKKEVYDPAPDGKCYHYYRGFEHIWKSMRRIGK